jgi:hypothetical protein
MKNGKIRHYQNKQWRICSIMVIGKDVREEAKKYYETLK